MLLSHYSEDDVNEAKDVILNQAKKMDIDVKDIDVRRQDSSTRSAKEAETDDILGLYTKMISVNQRKAPRFCCDDVSCLPPTAPEAGGSLLSLFEVMAKQQRQLLQMESAMASLQANVMKNTEKLAGMVPTYAAAVCPGESGKTSVTTPSISYFKAVEGAPGTSRINQEMVSAALQQVTEGAAGFNAVHGNGKRQLKGTGKLTARPRKPPQAGAADDNGSLSSGPEVFHVQLTNVSPKITEDEITQYITEKNDKLDINEIKDTSSEGWETKRFCLTFNMEFFDEIMNDQFWPKGIYYKQWYRIKSSSRKQPGVF
jgi:hypothetical protein